MRRHSNQIGIGMALGNTRKSEVEIAVKFIETEEKEFSASGLVGHLNCRYLTSLDLAVASGVLTKPFVAPFQNLTVLQ
jgi:hypothetical protein